MFPRSARLILQPLLSSTHSPASSLRTSFLLFPCHLFLPRAHHTIPPTLLGRSPFLPLNLRRPHLPPTTSISPATPLIHQHIQSRTFRIPVIPPPPSSSRYSYNRFKSRPQSILHLWKTSQTFRQGVLVVITGATGVYLYNIETVPVSGRRRFNIISPRWESSIAKSMYASTLQEFRGRILPEGHPMTQMVRRVMERLINVSGMEDLNWEVFVINDDSVSNAFVIPGGKVFVFSGMLPICQNDDGLAAVLSHEISHTVARHISERLSKSILAVIALSVTSAMLGIGDGGGGFGRLLMDLAYLRPSSRKQEAEADYIGLMMMSSACYNPREAVRLWERMEKAEKKMIGGGGAPPQFLSTHPSHRTRIGNLESWLPEALDKQAQSDCQQTMDYAEQFRRAFELPVW